MLNFNHHLLRVKLSLSFIVLLDLFCLWRKNLTLTMIGFKIFDKGIDFLQDSDLKGSLSHSKISQCGQGKSSHSFP